MFTLFFFAALLEDFLVQDERNQSLKYLHGSSDIQSMHFVKFTLEIRQKASTKIQGSVEQKGHGELRLVVEASDNMVSGKWLWKWLLEWFSYLWNTYTYRF